MGIHVHMIRIDPLILHPLIEFSKNNSCNLNCKPLPKLWQNTFGKSECSLEGGSYKYVMILLQN